jgi:hypothetical protein
MIYREYLFPFYQWSLSEIERDNAEDFAFVRKFKYAGAWSYLQFIDTLNKNQQREFSLARMRYGHAKRRKTPGVELSEAESNWIAAFFKFIEQPLFMLQRREATLPDPPVRPLTKSTFGKDIASSPSKHIRESLITRHQSNIWMDYPYRGMKIHTLFDIGGSPRSLSFDHWLETADGRRLIEHEGPLSCRGIASATWYRPAAEDGPRIVELVAESLERFIGAVDFVLDYKRE